MCVNLQPDLIVTNRHHGIKSQSLIHTINFLLESGYDLECIANKNNKKTLFQTLAELRLKVENGICGSFNQSKWDCYSACLVPVLVSQHVAWVHLKAVAFWGGRGGGRV